MLIDKNDSLPRTYRNFPYQYTRTSLFLVLRKNNDEVFLQGDDETQFSKIATGLNKKAAACRT